MHNLQASVSYPSRLLRHLVHNAISIPPNPPSLTQFLSHSAQPTAPVYVNSTVPVVTKVAPTTSVGTVTPVATKPVTFTGAGNRAAAGSAAGLAGLLGLAAYIL